MGASPHVEIGELRPKCHLARITHLRRDPTSCVSLSSSLSSSFLFPIVGFGHAPFTIPLSLLLHRFTKIPLVFRPTGIDSSR
jgi:hypothetical protein